MTADPAAGRLRGAVREFLAGQAVPPHCDSWMSEFDPAFSRALGERGWIGMTWPARYGGARYGGGERPERDRLVVIEELLAAGAPVSAHWFADRQIGPALLRHGSPEQRARYLPVITRGECFFAIGMSEPDSGSDLASIRTTARPAGTGWRISGRKVWTSHAARAHYLLALVRTSPRDPQHRHAGLSQLIVDLAAPGVGIRPIRSLDGRCHFSEITLDDVQVPADALLGREGSGWQQATAELAYERSGPERFLSTAPLLWELARRRAGHDDPRLGGLIAELQTLRALSTQIADALQRGAAPAREAAMVKDLGARFEAKVVDTARDLVDVEPALDSPDDLARLLAEAIVHRPGGTLRGGTTEILRGIIARDLVAP
ncbi:MAG TPA: acyl-CoA dehydrogenase family protein [Streptosporangiaceae bacterium]|nr:acyl-CoA dehydrogenase family protein [Streptosporangiaceae bacterium]